jgi:hypothetical protein
MRLTCTTHFFGVVDASVDEAIELFANWDDAKRFLDEVVSDEPQWATILCIREIDLGETHSN